MTLQFFFVHRDGFLDTAEFGELCRALFRDEEDKAYHIDPKRLKDMFDTFDTNQACTYIFNTLVKYELHEN